MLSHERKTHLLTELKKAGRIVAKDASLELGLSEDTIRRDLRELASEGLLKRVHGGAVPQPPANVDFPQRLPIASSEKQKIGKTAARMIGAGQVVFIDGGTTALQLVKHLPYDLNATIITHSPNVVMALLNHANLGVEVVGGRLFRHSIVTAGAATIACLDRYRPDICFIGVTGVNAREGFTTGDSEEAEVKRAIIRRSGEAIILASSEKLGAVASFKIADWSDVTRMIVSRETSRSSQKRFRSLGCDIVIADD